MRRGPVARSNTARYRYFIVVHEYGTLLKQALLRSAKPLRMPYGACPMGAVVRKTPNRAPSLEFLHLWEYPLRRPEQYDLSLVSAEAFYRELILSYNWAGMLAKVMARGLISRPPRTHPVLFFVSHYLESIPGRASKQRHQEAMRLATSELSLFIGTIK